MKRLAFTMLELVFVIIVIGILAILALPNFTSYPLQQAAEQVAEHIRYTQHLAMNDNKFDPNDPTWWQERWQIRFPRTTVNGEKIYYYEVFSDENQAGNSNAAEEAIDPLTHQNIGDGVAVIGSIPEDSLVNLTKQFNINSVRGTCIMGSVDVAPDVGAYRTLAFDHYGRPYLDVYSGAYDNVLTNDCTIILSHQDGTAVITVRPETGYVSISYP